MLDAGQAEDDFGEDDSTWDKQREGVGRGQVEFVLVLIESPRPSVRQRVQCADYQSNKSKGGLKGRATHAS